MRIRFFDPARAFAADRDALTAAFERVLGSGQLVLGPEVEAFEREFAALAGVGAAVGVASGTDALELALRALEVPPGAEVACPNLTAPATATAILRAGLRLVIVDVGREALVLDPARVSEALRPETGAVVAVHLYGRPAPVPELRELGLPVVEDAAQAHGLPLGGGALAAFSFYPTKNLGGLGDGGAVTTGDRELAERVRRLRTYGEHPRHFARELGANSRLDELQAALLLVRLRRLPAENERRREIAFAYDRALGRSSPPGVHHLYVVRSPARDELRRRLAERGIGTSVHYPWTLADQPAFAAARRAGPLRESEHAARELVSIPCYGGLRDAEVEHIAGELRQAARDGLL